MVDASKLLKLAMKILYFLEQDKKNLKNLKLPMKVLHVLDLSIEQSWSWPWGLVRPEASHDGLLRPNGHDGPEHPGAVHEFWKLKRNVKYFRIFYIFLGMFCILIAQSKRL